MPGVQCGSTFDIIAFRVWNVFSLSNWNGVFDIYMLLIGQLLSSKIVSHLGQNQEIVLLNEEGKWTSSRVPKEHCFQMSVTFLR